MFHKKSHRELEWNILVWIGRDSREERERERERRGKELEISLGLEGDGKY